MVDVGAPPPSPPTRSPRPRGELFAHWLAAVVWNGMFGTLGVLILLDRLETTAEIWEWVLVSLAALGPLLLLRALWETLRWRRFRRGSLRHGDESFRQRITESRQRHSPRARR